MIVQPQSMTVCVALVTFNRKALLLECLDALLAQTRPVDKIIIVDNGSTDGTADLLVERGCLSNPFVELIREEKNSGGAGGFYRGIELGTERGYDWIWLMDDDAEPEIAALAEALSVGDRPEVAAIGNCKTSAIGEPLDIHMQLESGEPATRYAGAEQPQSLIFYSSVGLLLRARVLAKVGLPLREFFLNQDDIEHCGCLRKAGTILLVPRSVIRHKEAARPVFVKRGFLGIRSGKEPFRSLIFRYFEMRNVAWFYGREHGRVALFVYAISRIAILSTKVIVFRDDHPGARIYLIYKAYVDALASRFDNEFPFRMLKRQVKQRA